MLWPSGIRTREESSGTNLKINVLQGRSLELTTSRVKNRKLGRIERRIGIMLSVDSFSPLIQSVSVTTGLSNSSRFGQVREEQKEERTILETICLSNNQHLK